MSCVVTPLISLAFTNFQRGMKYTLASGKMIQDKKGGGRQYGIDKRIELVYIRTQGLQKELEKICSFSSLEPGKVVARLGKNAGHFSQ